MRSKANKQSKLMQIILAPIKLLQKARDFYMKGMMDCAGRVDCEAVLGGPTSQFVPLPKSFSFNSSKESNDEEFKEILRQVSKKRSEMESNLHERRGEPRGTTMGSSGIGRSYSVGIGKIGAIAEDRPCSFREDDNMEKDLYARSRSHAVRRNVVYY